MIKNALKYKILFLSLFLLSACGTNDDTQSKNYATSVVTLSEKSDDVASLLDEAQSNTILPANPSYTFAQDLVRYDIASLEESEEKSSITKASPLSDVQVSAQQAGDDMQNNIEENSTIEDELDTASSLMSRYNIIGRSNVLLNDKEYEFKIAQDLGGHLVGVPTFIKKDGFYVIGIKCFCIEKDELLLDDGVFSMEIELPSLSERGYYKVSSNILTNSAQEDIYAYVEVSDEDSIKFSAKVDDFFVYSRDRSKNYVSNFELNFELR